MAKWFMNAGCPQPCRPKPPDCALYGINWTPVDYDPTDWPTYWDEISGTWVHQLSVGMSATGNSQALLKEPNFDGFVYLQTSLFASLLPDGTYYDLYCNADGAGNYFYGRIELTSGFSQMRISVGAQAGELAAKSVNWRPDQTAPINLCYSPDSQVLRLNVYQSPGPTNLEDVWAIVPDNSYRRVGIGGNAPGPYPTANLWYNFAHFIGKHEGFEHCPACETNYNCPLCIAGTIPSAFAVTLDGWADPGVPSCPDCPDMNDNYIAIIDEPQECLWGFSVPLAPCDGQGHGAYVIQIQEFAGEVYASVQPSLGMGPSFQVNLGPTPVDCSTIDTDVPLLGVGDETCDVSNATCHITAIP